MFDYRTIVTDDELTVNFVESHEFEVNYDAIDKTTGTTIGTVTIDHGTFTATDDNVFMQYKLWQTRPERAVGRRIELEGKNMEELIDAYEELFVGAYIMQTKRPVAKENNAFGRALDWLRTTDFYTAPASTRYHDSMPGGLLVHSLKVYNQLCDLISLPAFKNVDIAEITLVALMHDWCKIGYYEVYQKNVKDEKTGTWNKENAYRVNQTGVPLGHGVTSLFLASRIINLTAEQALAIRWHMSHWNVAEKEESEYQLAVNNYPMVYMIQIADQLACNAYTN